MMTSKAKGVITEEGKRFIRGFDLSTHPNNLLPSSVMLQAQLRPPIWRCLRHGAAKVA